MKTKDPKETKNTPFRFLLLLVKTERVLENFVHEGLKAQLRLIPWELV